MIQYYSDGKIDRWIELPGPGGKEPESPAPILKLTAGAQSAKSQAPSDEAEHGHLARTGLASRALVLVAGLLLLLGGLAIMGGEARRYLT